MTTRGIEAGTGETRSASICGADESPVPSGTRPNSRAVSEAVEAEREACAAILNKSFVDLSRELGLRGPTQLESPVRYASFVWQSAIRARTSISEVEG